MMASEQKVAIVGAGITGLLTAHGLKKNGIDVVVYERDVSIDARGRDWTILIHWALPLLAKLLPIEIIDRLPTAICNPNLEFNADVECLAVYNGATGDLLFKSPTPGARRVSRQKLRKLLVEGLDINWGCRVKELYSEGTGAVKLEFEEGREPVKVGFVAGADGASSRVRAILLGEEKARALGSGYMFGSGMPRYGDREKVMKVVETHPVAALSMGADAVGGVGVFSAEDPEKPEDWITFWLKIWKGEPVTLEGADALRFMKTHTEGLTGIFRDTVEWTPEGSPCWINEMRYWLAEPWDNRGGRVTLLGDAAHPMLIFRGQGLQHAVTDTVNYVESMTKILHSGEETDAGELISAIERGMIERGNKAVKQSLEEADKALDSEKVAKMLMATKGHGRE